MSTEITDKCTKVKRVINVRIECDPPPHIERYMNWITSARYGSEEWYKKLEESYNDWVKEFTDFVRDHRSQDPVHLNVVKDTKEVCSNCGSEWETELVDGKLVCTSCEKEINK